MLLNVAVGVIAWPRPQNITAANHPAKPPSIKRLFIFPADLSKCSEAVNAHAPQAAVEAVQLAPRQRRKGTRKERAGAAAHEENGRYIFCSVSQRRKQHRHI